MKTIDIYITELCNLDCEYCYVEIKKNEVDSIDGTEFTQSINLLEYDLIKFYGGEPLLKWKDIKDIISSVFQKNKAIRFSIITNGLLLTAEKLDFLKAHNSSVALSLHENSLKKTLSTHFLKTIFPYRNIIGFIILFSYKKPEFGFQIFRILVKIGFRQFSFTPLANIFWTQESFDVLKRVLNQAKYFIQIYPDISLSDSKQNYLKSLNDDRYCKKNQVDHTATKRNCTRFHREKELDNKNFVSEIQQIFETYNQCSSCHNRWFCVCPIGRYFDNKKDSQSDEHLAKNFHTLNEIMISFHRDIVRLQGKKNYMTEHIHEIRFNLTQQCNLRCNYCYLDFTNNTLDQKTGENIIDFYIEQQGEKKIISFFGGEPLLVFETLKSLALYAIQKAELLNKKVSFKIATNGLLLDKNKISFLKEHVFEIHLSINGDEKINDATRDASSKLLQKKIELLLKYEYPQDLLVVLFVVFPFSINSLDVYFEYIVSYGFKRILLEVYLGEKWQRNTILFKNLGEKISLLKAKYGNLLNIENFDKKTSDVVLDISTKGEIQENSLEFFNKKVDFSPKKSFDHLFRDFS